MSTSRESSLTRNEIAASPTSDARSSKSLDNCATGSSGGTIWTLTSAESPGPRGRKLVLELARLVDDPILADRLETAYGRETKVLALTIPERSTILAALEDPPAELAELRGVLLRELAWLRQEGSA